MAKKICVIDGDQTRTAESYFFCERRSARLTVWSEKIDLNTVCDAFVLACQKRGKRLLPVVCALVYAWCTARGRYKHCE